MNHSNMDLGLKGTLRSALLFKILYMDVIILMAIYFIYSYIIQQLRDIRDLKEELRLVSLRGCKGMLEDQYLSLKRVRKVTYEYMMKNPEEAHRYTNVIIEIDRACHQLSNEMLDVEIEMICA